MVVARRIRTSIDRDRSRRKRVPHRIQRCCGVRRVRRTRGIRRATARSTHRRLCRAPPAEAVPRLGQRPRVRAQCQIHRMSLGLACRRRTTVTRVAVVDHLVHFCSPHRVQRDVRRDRECRSRRARSSPARRPRRGLSCAPPGKGIARLHQRTRVACNRHRCTTAVGSAVGRNRS